jgi:hypothetical protein
MGDVMPSELLSWFVVPVGLLIVMAVSIRFSVKNWRESRDSAWIAIFSAGFAFILSWIFWPRAIWQYLLISNLHLTLVLVASIALYFFARWWKNRERTTATDTT